MDPTGQGTATKPEPVALPAALDAVLPALRAAPRVWLAYSGGHDSDALLDLLARRLTNLAATHVDHGLHPDSRAWAARCVRRCEALGVACRVARLADPPTAGIEAWARSGRYRIWRELLRDGELLLTAHHLDDQIETVALRLLQGRHPLPIPHSRPLGAGRVLRPLLGVARETLLGAREDPAAAAISDPANDEPRFLRNRVRHRLLPALTAQAPAGADWPAALARLGGLVSRLQRALQLAVVPDNAACGALVRLSLDAVGPGAFIAILANLGCHGWTLARARETLGQLQRGARGPIELQTATTGPPLEAWVEACVEAGGATALLLWRPPAPPRRSTVAAGASVDLPHGRLLLGARGGTLRYPRPSDRLVHGDRRVRVVELLRAAGVARYRRASWPLLIDTRGIVEVAGIAARDGARPQCRWQPSR